VETKFIPVFTLKGERFVFAYQDQLYDTREQAEFAGGEIAWKFKMNKAPVEYKEVIDAGTISSRLPTMMIGQWRICFIDRALESKRKRGKRAKKSMVCVVADELSQA
jgi:hypothetical protein